MRASVCGLLLASLFIGQVLADGYFSIDVDHITNSNDNCDFGHCNTYFKACMDTVLSYPNGACGLSPEEKSDTFMRETTFDPNYVFTFFFSGGVEECMDLRLQVWDYNRFWWDDMVESTQWVVCASAGKATVYTAQFSKVYLAITVGLLCAPNFYGANCSQYCPPSNTYVCTEDGSRLCQPGYTGELCNIRCPLGSSCPGGVPPPCAVPYLDSNSQWVCNITGGCPAGTYVPAAVLSGEEQGVCGLCNGIDNYQDQSNQPACKPVTECGAGSYSSVAPTPTSDRVCTSCNLTGLVLNETIIRTCNLNPAEICPVGTYFDGNVNAQSPCVSCDGVTGYQDLIGQSSCKNVTGCVPGFFEVAPPTPSSNTQCSLCSVRCSACDTAFNCTECFPGSFLDGTLCVGRCPPDTYGNSTLSACVPKTICPNGTEVVVAGSPTSDRVCDVCPPGTSDGDNDPLTPCVACSPGTFSAAAGVVGNCSWCPAGTVDDDDNPLTPCVPCGAGNFVPSGSAGNCSLYACPPGTFDDDSLATTVCVSCPADEFQSDSGATTCQTCNASITTCPVFFTLSNCTATANTFCAPILFDNLPSDLFIGGNGWGVGAGIIGAGLGLFCMMLIVGVLFGRHQMRRRANPPISPPFAVPGQSFENPMFGVRDYRKEAAYGKVPPKITDLPPTYSSSMLGATKRETPTTTVSTLPPLCPPDPSPLPPPEPYSAGRAKRAGRTVPARVTFADQVQTLDRA